MSAPFQQPEEGPPNARICTGVVVLARLQSNGTTAIFLHAFLCYSLTSAIVLLGVAFGHRFLEVHDGGVNKGSILSSFANQDGCWYKQIVTRGYSYNPDERSPVAFFPLYPLLAACLISATGIGPEAGLLIVSHACLASAFVLTAVYVKQKVAASPAGLADYVLLSMGLMPATLFFRMAYSESLFLLLSVLALQAMTRQWPLLVVALIVGLTTSARSVGIGLLVPFLLHCWHRSSTRWDFVIKTVFLLPIACWGIAGFALYQGVFFGEPMAFVQTQSHWGHSAGFSEKFSSLLSYEPIWQVYDPFGPAYWGLDEPYPRNPLFCWAAVNPLYFLISAFLVLIGATKRWLSSYETTLAVSLLLIPYLTRSSEMAMASQARFAAVIFPIYLVLGNILVRLPSSVAGALLGVSAFLLGAYSAMFATWYQVF